MAAPRVRRVRQLVLRGEEDPKPAAEGGEDFGNEGIFLVTLDENGKRTDFREWWNSRLLHAPS